MIPPDLAHGWWDVALGLAGVVLGIILVGRVMLYILMPEELHRRAGGRWQSPLAWETQRLPLGRSLRSLWHRFADDEDLVPLKVLLLGLLVIAMLALEGSAWIR